METQRDKLTISEALPFLLMVFLLAVGGSLLLSFPGKEKPEPYSNIDNSLSPWSVLLRVVSAVVVIMLLAGVAVVGWRLALYLWERTEEARSHVADLRISTEHGRLTLDKARLQITEKVYPDSVTGSFPLLWDGSNLLDANRGAVMSLPDGVHNVEPNLAKGEFLRTWLKAARGWPESKEAVQLLASAETSIHWPSRVPLRGLLDGEPSYRKLVIGVTMVTNSAGEARPEVVRADLSNLVHVAVGGSSGWGKSVFARSMALQLAQSVDPVSLAMVDLEAVTFAPFGQCARLLWPIADDEQAAHALFEELEAELNQRKALFAQYPGVDSLMNYNARANGDGLRPIVCLVDEATALLSNKNVESALRTLALRGRKYGLWLALFGQDWKATSLDTSIRNQLGARIQFKAMSTSQSRILLSRPGAENLPAKGRALAWLPGREMVELQTPWVSQEDIAGGIGKGNSGSDRPGHEPQRALKLTALEGPNTDNVNNDYTTEQIIDLATEGMTPTAISKAVFGYANARTIERVRAVLDNNK